MKTLTKSILITILSAQCAQAGWFEDSVGNLGRALGDVGSLGQAGRDRDREFAEKQEQIARMVRDRMLAERDGAIKSLENSILQSTTARDNAIKVRTKNTEIVTSLKYILDVFTSQIAGTYKLEASVQLSKITAQLLKNDLDVLKVFLNQVTNKQGQSQATDLLVQVASSRNLSVAQFIEQTMAQSQFSKAVLIKVTKDLTEAYPRYIEFDQEQLDYINSEQEKINLFTAQLATIRTTIEQEIAAVKESARKAQEASDAAEKERQRIENQMRRQPPPKFNPRAI